MATKNVEIEKSKRARCRHCFPHFEKDHVEHHCVVDGEGIVVSKEECENCSRFDSKYIEYPLTINGIENDKIDTSGLGHECGTLCEIRPCAKEYEGKSFIGIYIGDLPIGINSSYNRKTGVLHNYALSNPAIFVPELKKIIYGCESWWREIESIEDFKGISKDDINNTWYVQLLKRMS